MTDLTNQTEKVFKCPAKGCAAMVPASGREEHKRGHSEESARWNRINQFLQRYGGDYLGERLDTIDRLIKGDGTHQNPGIDADVKRHEEEIGGVIERLDVLETNKGNNGQPSAGVQVDTWDDPDLANDTTDDNVTPIQPAGINPMTGLPYGVA